MALVNEGWMRVLSPEEMDARDPKRRNEEYPDRIETLLINLLTEHKQAVMMCKIDRTARTLEKPPIQWVDKKTTSGRMIR